MRLGTTAFPPPPGATPRDALSYSVGRARALGVEVLNAPLPRGLSDDEVARVRDELAAAGLELAARGGDIRDAKRDPRGVGDERFLVALGVPEAERHVRRLDLTLRVIALAQPEYIAVEAHRSLDVTRRHRHVVHLLDLHYSYAL